MNVFIDTNIHLDVLARREPFYADSAEVWTLAETGRISGFASTLSLPNLYYLLRRVKGQQAARKALGILRDIFTLVPLDVQIANQAIDAGIKDFEDAIQFFSALRAGEAFSSLATPSIFRSATSPSKRPPSSWLHTSRNRTRPIGAARFSSHRPSAGRRASTGSLMVTCVPRPGSLCSVIWPLWPSMIFRVVGRPRPEPPRLVEKKVSNIFACVASSMPQPVSIRSRATPSAVP